MKGLLKPKRKIRLDNGQIGGDVYDDGHSWAVSYADFLMVLLSFFVIFFSLDPSQKDSIIDEVAQKTSFKAGKGGKEKDRTIASVATLPEGVNKIGDELDGFFVERDKKQKLFIYFDDDIYPPGKIDLPRAQIEKLKAILAQLAPYHNEINVIFVGHTDDQAVARSRSRYLTDNFDLSSLRATRALQQAVKANFDPRHMYAQGVAEHTRGTRTLSLVITPRETQ